MKKTTYDVNTYRVCEYPSDNEHKDAKEIGGSRQVYIVAELLTIVVSDFDAKISAQCKQI